MTEADAELDANAAMLSEAGLIETYVNDEGKQVAQQMALSGEDDVQALLNALLDARKR